MIATWYAVPNTLIGGWDVRDVDRDEADDHEPHSTIAAFMTEQHAHQVAREHNAHDALVEALERATTYLHSCPRNIRAQAAGILNQADTALRLAGALE